MALLYSEGFDKILDRTQFEFFGITSGDPTNSISATGGRFGGRCAVHSAISATPFFRVSIPPQDLTTGRLHAAGWFTLRSTAASRYPPLIAFYSTASAKWMGVGVYQGNLEVFAWTATTTNAYWWTSAAVIATYPVSGTGYHHIEICCDVKDSGGVFKLWLDGVLVIDFSGDTRHSTSGGENAVDRLYYGFGYNSTSITAYIDDIVCWNELGDTFNTAGPLGEHRIWTLTPEGDHDCQFTPSTGSNHYAVVDDTTLDVNDYNMSDTPGAVDLFSFSDLSVSPTTIHDVSVRSVAYKSGTGAVQLQSVLKLNDTVYEGEATTLATANTAVRVSFSLNPATEAAWTTAMVNNLVAGYRYVS